MHFCGLRESAESGSILESLSALRCARLVPSKRNALQGAAPTGFNAGP